jgi:hypothetical protein
LDGADQGEAVREVDLLVAVVVDAVAKLGGTGEDRVLSVVAVVSRGCGARGGAVPVTVAVERDLDAV